MIRGADVARDGIKLIRRDIDAVAFGVLKFEVLALQPVHRAPHQAPVAGDAVVRVYKVITAFEVGDDVGPDPLPRPGWAAALAESEHLPAGDHAQPLIEDEAARERDGQQRDCPRARQRWQMPPQVRRNTVRIEDFGEAQRLLGSDYDGAAVACPACRLAREWFEFAREGRSCLQWQPPRPELFGTEALKV